MCLNSNPDGGGELVEGLMGVRKGDLRDVRVPLPFSVKEMLPFTGVDQPLSPGSSPPPSPRVSATGFLDTEDPDARGSTPLSSDGSQTPRADTGVTGNLSVFEMLTKEAGQKCGLDVDLDETSQVVDTEEERLVQTILRVKCHGVKKRVQEQLGGGSVALEPAECHMAWMFFSFLILLRFPLSAASYENAS